MALLYQRAATKPLPTNLSVMKTVTKPLVVKMLGQPEARYDGQLLRFRSRKVLALLLYLVVTGEWHTRDKLLALAASPGVPANWPSLWSNTS